MGNNSRNEAAYRKLGLAQYISTCNNSSSNHYHIYSVYKIRCLSSCMESRIVSFRRFVPIVRRHGLECRRLVQISADVPFKQGRVFLRDLHDTTANQAKPHPCDRQLTAAVSAFRARSARVSRAATRRRKRKARSLVRTAGRCASILFNIALQCPAATRQGDDKQCERALLTRLVAHCAIWSPSCECNPLGSLLPAIVLFSRAFFHFTRGALNALTFSSDFANGGGGHGITRSRAIAGAFPAFLSSGFIWISSLCFPF